MSNEANKRNIFPVRNRSDIPRLVRAYSDMGQDCPFEFEGEYPKDSIDGTQWWMKIEPSPKGKHIFDLLFYTDQQLVEAVNNLTPDLARISLVFDSPAHGDYEHLHKNLWLVRTMEGLYAAARKAGRVHGNCRIKLDTKMHVTVDASKFPAIVALEKSKFADTVEVVSIMTDTTMRFALEKMAGIQTP
jgi:hypothetical protein